MVIEAQGNTQGMKVSILFDFGATNSFISFALVASGGIPVVKARDKWQVELASGIRVSTNIVVFDCMIRMKSF